MIQKVISDLLSKAHGSQCQSNFIREEGEIFLGSRAGLLENLLCSRDIQGYLTNKIPLLG